jgi:hypothetical protein
VKLLPALALCLAAAPAAAQNVLSEVTGNWAAPGTDGFYFRAVLTAEGDMTRLRIWQGMAPDDLGDDPQFDNPNIALLSGGRNAQDWLEFDEATGELRLLNLSETDGYHYVTELVIQYLDNQFTTKRYGFYNNYPDGGDIAPADPASCWSDACYSCEADIRGGKGIAGTQTYTIPQRPFEDLNASLWQPGREWEIGACPAPD